MPAAKPTISLDPELYTAVKAAADDAGVSFSAWIEGAARDRLRGEALDAAIADYEAEHGEITEEEMAATELGRWLAAQEQAKSAQRAPAKAKPPSRTARRKTA